MESKKMIKEATAQNKKIKYSERVTLEVIKDTKFYKKGQVIKPHSLMGEQLIKDKIAKAV